VIYSTYSLRRHAVGAMTLSAFLGEPPPRILRVSLSIKYTDIPYCLPYCTTWHQASRRSEGKIIPRFSRDEFQGAECHACVWMIL